MPVCQIAGETGQNPPPTDRSEGINVVDVPIARGRRASSASQMAFAVPVIAELVIGAEDNDKVARIHLPGLCGELNIHSLPAG